MRVVLDAYWWVRGTQSLKHVVHGLTETWSAEHPDDEIVMVVRRKHLDDVGVLPPNIQVVSTRLWPQALSAMFSVPWHARRRGADAMLSHNFSPLFSKGRGVYIQDVMFATNPEWFSRKELLYYRWMTRSARRSEVLFSSTATEGARISAHTRAGRVVTAGMGLSADVIAGDGQPDPRVREGSFLLAVGRLNVRKNLINTLEGARESGLLTPDFPLVIVGERDGEWDALPLWVHEAEQQGSVIFTGFISVEELRWLIRSCRVYVCLSLDEGFGLPPVEARALGAAVLVSDRPIFHETLAGDEAWFVDPLSPEAIGKLLSEIVGSTAWAPDRTPSELMLERHTWRNVVRVMRRELLATRGVRA